ncbi:5-deoxy-glucuronate isomerase [Aliifodinibius sp. S!AR15-10]|uniref:5-deoxy-glucuronate isomerase n=1 Tax=Aliifodinibius sp. S!AR15-10 TaxID=2950437 RepID=UPI00286FCA4D|nr:5-deoxy-glucuronate isomerase [Aliifodinibius sp. S!AR15-10]
MKRKKILFRNTAGKKGRNWIITPENSELEALGYARIILDKEVPSVSYENPNFEAAFICLGGEGTVSIGSASYEVKPYDSIFLPPGNEGVIKTESTLDILESTAPSDQQGNPVFIPFGKLNRDKKLTQMLSTPPSQRKLHRIIDENVPAQRLLCGLDFSKEGNWTSWAPHEHAATKEEIYIYFDMPAPAFGIQLVYEDLDHPEYLGPVYEGDAVVIKRGYHPNVAIPGHPINFVWIMATLDPSMERSWADVNTQPEFA